MALVLGTSKETIISEHLDSDGDLEIFTGCVDWLTREDAIKLVDHLNKVFELETNRD